MGLKAIETTYNGLRFRSRLEARWAVFFDESGLRYEYEKEGFDLDGLWFLPDFWLPDKDCWAEIKGAEPHYQPEEDRLSEDMEKCARLARHSGKAVFWLRGQIPNLRVNLKKHGSPDEYDDEYNPWDALQIQGVDWFKVTPQFDFDRTGWEGLEVCWPGEEYAWLYNEAALLKARQARFEWGEKEA